MKSNLICKAVLLLIGVCTILSAAGIAPALPIISKHFDNSELVPWILLASNYAMMCFAPFFGKVVSKLGALRTMRCGLIWYALCGCVAFLLDNVEMIIVSRIAFAVGTVAVMICLNVLVAYYFDGDERRAFIGFQGFVASLISLGIIQMSGLMAEMGWNFPFLLYGYGIIMWFLTFLLPKVQKTSTSASGASNSRLEITQQKTFTRPVVVTLATLVFAMMVYYVAMLYAPFLMSEVGGTPANSGTAIVLLTLTGAVSSLSFGKIKLSAARIFALSFALVAAGYVVLYFATSPMVVFAGVVVAGFGIGFLLPNSTARLMTVAHPSTIPMVMSFLVVCIFGGNAIGGTVAQVIRNMSDTPTAFLAAAIGSAVVSTLYFLGKKN